MAFWNRSQPAPPGIRADARRSAEIDDYVLGQVKAGGPGLSLAVVSGGNVVHSVGYGLADLNGTSPNTPDTIFILRVAESTTGLGSVCRGGKLRRRCREQASSVARPIRAADDHSTLLHIRHPRFL